MRGPPQRTNLPEDPDPSESASAWALLSKMSTACASQQVWIRHAALLEIVHAAPDAAPLLVGPVPLPRLEDNIEPSYLPE